MLDVTTKWQRHLVESSSVIPPLYAGVTAFTGPPSRLVGLGAANHYWAALYTAFHGGDCNACSVKGTLSLKKLEEELVRNDLPFPIFGATARDPDDGPCDDGDKPPSLAQSYFELSPLRQGTAGGYTDSGLGLSMTDAVGISGAAIPEPGTKLCRPVAALGLGLNRRLEYESLTNAAAPEGPDGTKGWFRTRNHQVLLSDGGHSDNLAVFPLVQRLCQSTLVIDAEEDPGLTFWSLNRLTKHLERRGIHWTKPLTNRDRLQALRIGDPGGFKADKLADPIFKGKVGPIPLVHRTTSARGFELSMLEPRIYYAKLSMNEKEIKCDRLVLSELESFYCRERAEFTQRYGEMACSPGLFGACPFPHTRTLSQNFSEARFKAYRDLGMELGQRLSEAYLRDLAGRR